MKKLIKVIFLCLFIISGCTPKVARYFEENTITREAKVNANFDKVYNYTLQVLKNNGYEIEDASLQRRIIITKYRVINPQTQSSRKIISEFGEISNTQTMMLIHSVSKKATKDHFLMNEHELNKLKEQIMTLSSKF